MSRKWNANVNVGNYVMLYGAIVFFSCISIISKLASEQMFLSGTFILLYGLEIVALGIYAVVWQQVLKRFELSVAYTSKPVATLLSMAWGVLLFQEKFTWNMILGTIFIFAGLWVVNAEHE